MQYGVPITYTMEVYIVVDADSVDEAIDIASGVDFSVGDGEYVEDTIEIQEAEVSLLTDTIKIHESAVTQLS